MIEITLDGTSGMDAIHAQLAETFRFPDYYGRNLDALYDCLTEVREDARIHVINTQALGRRGQALQLVLTKAALTNPHLQIL